MPYLVAVGHCGVLSWHVQWNEIVPVLSIALAFLTLILTYRQVRLANPKRRISVHVRGCELGWPSRGKRRESLDLVDPGSPAKEAAGAYRIMNDRTLVVITLEATGRADVSRDRFSKEAPFVVECGSTIYKVLIEDDVKKRNNIRLRDDRQAILLGPMLLKKGRPFELPLRIEKPVRDNFTYDDIGLRDVDVAFSVGDDPPPPTTVGAALKQTPHKGALILAACWTGLLVGWIVDLVRGG